VGALAALAAPGPASAAEPPPLQCSFAADTGELAVTGEAPAVYLAVVGDSGFEGDDGPPQIMVGERFGRSSALSCGTDVPTPTTVDRIIVRTTGSTELTIADPASFAPGLTPEADGVSEIEFEVALGSRADALVLEPEVVDWICCHVFYRRPLVVRAGADGVDFNPRDPAPDADLSPSGVDSIETRLNALDYADSVRVSGAGGPGVGDLTRIPMLLAGGNPPDVLKGGRNDDELLGGGLDGFGVDVLAGRAGDDVLSASFDGAAKLRGGRGKDRLQGGEGDDLLRGGSKRDVLTGGAGADRFYGGSGRDSVFADDGVEDLVIDCGPGKNERVRRDPFDPLPVNC
jgi:hypothetical protein